MGFFDETFVVTTGIIIGLPGDDLLGVKKTIDFLTKDMQRKCRIRLNGELLKVFPGTSFYHNRDKFGLIFQKEPPYYLISSLSFSEKDLADAISMEKEAREKYNI